MKQIQPFPDRLIDALADFQRLLHVHRSLMRRYDEVFGTVDIIGANIDGAAGTEFRAGIELRQSRESRALRRWEELPGVHPTDTNDQLLVALQEHSDALVTVLAVCKENTLWLAEQLSNGLKFPEEQWHRIPGLEHLSDLLAMAQRPTEQRKY
jgi:hypothetical protein